MLSFRKKNQVLPEGGGFWEVLKVALPLILSSSCHAANMFVDRLMLAQYSQTAVAASFTSGLTNFTLSSLLFGTISYTGTFVAQYEGAHHPERIGTAMWQGIWLAVLGGILFLTGFWWANPLFQLFHHDPAVTAEEVQYFEILCGGVFIFLLSSVFPCFWSGRGKTGFVLLISFIITLCNLPLNYILIFGHFGCPELGIRGAALGTVFSEVIGVFIYACTFFAPSARRHFHTLDCRVDFDLLKRMLRYGFPNGLNMALDMVSFNIFSLLLGCYSVTVLEASSITFGINNIAFCPVVGVGMTASILVGQAIGGENIPLARKAVRNCIYVVLIYNALMVLLFTVFQDVVLSPFVRAGDPSQIETMKLSGYMLYFIAGYLFFDGFNLVFSNALRGAGDTKFTMYTMMFVSIFLFSIPCLVFYYFRFPWWSLWCVLVGIVLTLCTTFTIRYLQGKWTKMRVIELPASEKAG